ncbi:hypothetical protein [uncultured Desulfovibrio sp.]|uniref:hypothetical protein n=1 Tax=uncultured Desulfovibrio sp. TaxID=167968 RepID=UPI002623AF87|nr:hypothetical protein [uncultured Desulfovibrio sp.]
MEQVLFHAPVERGPELADIDVDAGNRHAVITAMFTDRFQIAPCKRVRETVGKNLGGALSVNAVFAVMPADHEFE